MSKRLKRPWPSENMIQSIQQCQASENWLWSYLTEKKNALELSHLPETEIKINEFHVYLICQTCVTDNWGRIFPAILFSDNMQIMSQGRQTMFTLKTYHPDAVELYAKVMLLSHNYKTFFNISGELSDLLEKDYLTQLRENFDVQVLDDLLRLAVHTETVGTMEHEIKNLLKKFLKLFSDEDFATLLDYYRNHFEFSKWAEMMETISNKKNLWDLLKEMGTPFLGVFEKQLKGTFETVRLPKEISDKLLALKGHMSGYRRHVNVYSQHTGLIFYRNDGGRRLILRFTSEHDELTILPPEQITIREESDDPDDR
jgi:predicted DNA-binding protein YlxM (UPF0122 family)